MKLNIAFAISVTQILTNLIIEYKINYMLKIII